MNNKPIVITLTDKDPVVRELQDEVKRLRELLTKIVEHLHGIVSGDVDTMIITNPYGINGDNYVSKFARCKHGYARYTGCEICLLSHLSRMARRYEKKIGGNK